MDIKRTPLALIISLVMASQSYAQDSTEYCRNGGSATGYTCDQDNQLPDRDELNARSLASTDEAWMQGKLDEIKTWLRKEQESASDEQTQKNIRLIQKSINVTSPAATDPELIRIEAMSQKGNHRAAMSAINSYMASNPKSLEAKLTKSLILNNMGQFSEAEALLKNAIAKNPTSPELYNNLAVLYSKSGNYGQAIETLLQAFETHPTYAQVHKNLRELYATVASQTYSRALDLAENQNKPNLVMLRRASSTNQPVLAYQPSVISPEQKPQPKKTATAAKKPASSTAKVVKVEKPKKAKPSVKRPIVQPKVVETQTPNFSHKALGKEATAHVNKWAKAWAAQDVSGYLASYTSNFKPVNGLSNSAWKKQRKDRLTKPTFIKVKLSNMSVQVVNSSKAKVAFTQEYRSNTYKDKTRKLITLRKVNGEWKIADERQN